ncbi:hypothetical protein FA95DRAFT_1560216 [Auriscalpium vulgare]|uniref:Uncharacterized protein n=1 Tax=Auriscalpium vulgare TaxID=40419 RepID=A0ACB8RQN9_9AGAM|nr:hypothetical protein FA95DRAFT_1560216 [Auriscalpium vulgare]
MPRINPSSALSEHFIEPHDAEKIAGIAERSLRDSELVSEPHATQDSDTYDRYAPRQPMDQLPLKYKVTKRNPKPTLVHFAIPLDFEDIFQYGVRNNTVQYYDQCPGVVYRTGTIWYAAKHLSQTVQYKMGVREAYVPTADSGALLELYSNFSMNRKQLVPADEEDVVREVRELLRLDDSVRPRWYFDFNNKWQPGDADEDEERVMALRDAVARGDDSGLSEDWEWSSQNDNDYGGTDDDYEDICH